MTTTTETAQQHWLTKFDPDDGQPYGQICECEIGKHHYGNGDLTEPDDESSQPPVAIEIEPAEDGPGTAPTLTELIVEQLCYTHVIDGQVLRFEAVDHGDGRIELDVTRVEFDAESDTTMRLLLHVSGPLTPAEDVVEAEIVAEPGVEIGASA